MKLEFYSMFDLDTIIFNHRPSRKYFCAFICIPSAHRLCGRTPFLKWNKEFIGSLIGYSDIADDILNVLPQFVCKE